jgi:hypothetical protein
MLSPLLPAEQTSLSAAFMSALAGEFN